MATIEEIQRIVCVVPASIPHVITKNMNIKGFDIPKGAIFMANLTKFSKDPLVFPQPKHFLPERFLWTDVDGKLKLKVVLNPVAAFLYKILIMCRE